MKQSFEVSREVDEGEKSTKEQTTITQAATSTNDGQASPGSRLKSIEMLKKELIDLELQESVQKSTKEQTTFTEQAATSANSRQASPGSRLKSIATLTKEQIDLELQALETVTAQAAADCVSFTLLATQAAQAKELAAQKEQMDAQILELAMNVEAAKEKVCRMGGNLVGRLCATQHVMKLQGRDAGELQALETALEQATQTVKAFMAVFEDDED